MVATGNYINVWKLDNSTNGLISVLYDAFIALNEPNDPPTTSEVDSIETAINELGNYINSDEVYKAIDKLDLNCTKYGFNVYLEK